MAIHIQIKGTPWTTAANLLSAGIATIATHSSKVFRSSVIQFKDLSKYYNDILGNVTQSQTCALSHSDDNTWSKMFNARNLAWKCYSTCTQTMDSFSRSCSQIMDSLSNKCLVANLNPPTQYFEDVYKLEVSEILYPVKFEASDLTKLLENATPDTCLNACQMSAKSISSFEAITYTMNTLYESPIMPAMIITAICIDSTTDHLFGKSKSMRAVKYLVDATAVALLGSIGGAVVTDAVLAYSIYQIAKNTFKSIKCHVEIYDEDSTLTSPTMVVRINQSHDGATSQLLQQNSSC
jgi:hypothetical protein